MHGHDEDTMVLNGRCGGKNCASSAAQVFSFTVDWGEGDRGAACESHTVIYAVIEHIPNRKVRDLLSPGGKVYLDGTAAVTKYAVSAFARDYIWGGTHTFFTLLQDVVGELLYHGFEIVEIARETVDYQLKMEEWARRLDAAKYRIVAGWGEKTYRVFRLCLYGGAHAFKSNLQLSDGTREVL